VRPLLFYSMAVIGFQLVANFKVGTGLVFFPSLLTELIQTSQTRILLYSTP